MSPSSPRQPRPPRRPPERPERRLGGVLEDVLTVDGVTDLHAYRLLTGRGQDLADVPPPRPQRLKPGEQLGFLFAIPGGAE